MPRPQKPDALTPAERSARLRARGKPLAVTLLDNAAIKALARLSKQASQRVVVERALVAYDRLKAGSRKAR